MSLFHDDADQISEGDIIRLTIASLDIDADFVVTAANGGMLSVRPYDFDPSESELRAYYNVGGSDDPQYGPRARND